MEAVAAMDALEGRGRHGTCSGGRRVIDASAIYRRHERAVAVMANGRLLCLLPGRETHTFDGVDAEVFSDFWRVLSRPVSGAAVAEHLAAHPSLQEVVETLVGAGYVMSAMTEEPSDHLPPREGTHARCHRIVLAVSGAVHAVFAPLYVQRLLTDFTEQLDVILTKSSQRFVTPYALETLGARVWVDPFASSGPGSVPHMELARGADLMLVVPATAHVIHRMANGVCSDLLALVACATTAPVVVVPSMNEVMWDHPAVRRNVAQLRRDGVYLVEAGVGFEVADGDRQTVWGPAGLPPSAVIATLAGVLRLAPRG